MFTSHWGLHFYTLFGFTLMKIMIVDDHADMRRLLRNLVLLSIPWPVDVIECEDGEEAVRQFSVHRPDCVVMDVQLKTAMNGFEATERIYQADPNASVIFVTSHNTTAFREKAKVLHAKGFVTKDNLSELDHIIRSLS
jgi:DNA-binding NarL/FixJ family response regulator